MRTASTNDRTGPVDYSLIPKLATVPKMTKWLLPVFSAFWLATSTRYNIPKHIQAANKTEEQGNID